MVHYSQGARVKPQLTGLQAGALIVLVAMGGLCVLDLMDRHAAFAARNSSGTYSLPSGNPVVSGTVISSSTYNNTTSDMAGEITNSLDRNGRGAMLAPLQLAAGTVSAPGLTFSGDTGTGLYHIGAKDIAWAFNGTKGVEWNNGTETVSPLNANATGIIVNGAGTGSAVNATGGNTNGAGVFSMGGTNGPGVHAVGTGTGDGVDATGGASSAYGVSGTGGAASTAGVFGQGGSGSGGWGVRGAGDTGAAGGYFSNGTAATGATRQSAIIASNGDIDLTGVANPSSGTALKNLITPASLVKMFAQVQSAGGNSTSCTVQGGVNVSGCAAVNHTGNDCSSNYTLTVSLPAGGAMASGLNNVCYADCSVGAGAPDDHSSNHAVMLNTTTVSICGVVFTRTPTVTVWSAYQTSTYCYVQCVGLQ